MPTITVTSLSKSYGRVHAVQDLSFTVRPGRVTGLLGPNGAGKSTTLRAILGLVKPGSGAALIGGHRYADLPDPPRTVGAVLEATDFHPGRTVRTHLRALCVAGGLPPGRIGRVLAEVGLDHAADRRAGGLSLGMRRRLALASALLGDPPVLVLDEPANGLDPQGIHWLRTTLRELAGQGRTVLLSTHLLAEAEQGADDLVIVDGGRLVAAGTVAELVGARAGLEQAYLDLLGEGR
ncbi:ABC transporter [Sphaerisporangium rufum]|uniref:ABC transporter n=1 Tax=Sphaerisporangium rufum TaxID=1381558 RepID=A0A919QVZ9_9ACTN|nr:ATP-binding cassette domain-containing protein [Sphaerisporangium rufum]GII75094.1 ABC transporter [Sphaerisporangium rufum]